MRQQGRITVWKDDKGFGFITPDHGGDRAFLHISAFSSGTRRPVVNESVTFELSFDDRGRPRAVEAAFSGEPRRRIRPLTLVALLVVLGFASFIGGAVILGKLPVAILWVYLGISAATFLVYAFDKYAAIRGRRRMPENTLHLLSLAGGWPGALVAQRVFRHKSSKTSFQLTYWVTVVANGSIVWSLLSPAGSRFLRVLGLIQ